MRNVKIEYLKALSLGEGWERLSIVDEYKPAGTYELTWYAEGLPSGVYFYQLKIYPAKGGAEGFVETKKMVLMK
jgi:hypothetical protein